MAILRAKDAARLNEKDREEKLKDLKMELIKANVTAHKASAKTKEIKRAISRLLTSSKLAKNTAGKKVTVDKSVKEESKKK